MSKDKSREWLPECIKVNKVKSMYTYYVKTLLNRVTNMFTWDNLPETVDENFLAITLFTQGRVIWTDFLEGNPLRFFLQPIAVCKTQCMGKPVDSLSVALPKSKPLQLSSQCI